MNAVSARKINPLSLILLLLILLVALIPVLYSVMLSLMDYTPMRQLSSPFVGLQNFTQVIQHPAFLRLISNSFLLWLTSLVFALLLGVPTALLCSLSKSRKTTATCAGLLLVPVFIPASAYFILIFKLFSSAAFLRTNTYYLAFAAQTLFPGAALVAFAGVAVSLLYRAKGRPALHGAVLGCGFATLLLMCLTLSPAYEASLLSANPVVYQAADTFDNFTYRSGLTQMQISFAAALFVIRNILQTFLAVLPALVLVLLLKRADRQPFALEEGRAAGTAQTQSPGQVVAWIVLAVLVIALLFGGGLPSFAHFSVLARQFLPTLIVTILSVVVGLAVSCVLLFGAIGSGRVMLPLTAAIVLGSSNAILAQYLLARPFGLVNTVLATPLNQWLQPPILLVLFLFALIVFLCKNQTTVLLLAGAAALLIGAHALGGFIPHMIFTQAPQQYTLGMLLRSTRGFADQVINADPGSQALLYICTVLPCVLLGISSSLLIRSGLLKAA